MYLLQAQVLAQAKVWVQRQAMYWLLARAMLRAREMREAMWLRVREKQYQWEVPRLQSRLPGIRFPGSMPADLHSRSSPDKHSVGTGGRRGGIKWGLAPAAKPSTSCRLSSC